MAQPSRSRPSHLNPMGSIKLPHFRVPRGRLVLYVVTAGVLFVLVLFLLERFAGNAPVVQPNAIWIGTEWTYETHEDADVQGLVQRLRDHHIGTVYAWVSWLQEDETWRGAENFGAVKAFADQFKAAYPESALMGWVSYPVNVGENNYRLDNTELQQNVADFSQRIVTDLGFDGIFLNVEPVWNADENFLELLRKVRTSLGDGVPLAAAIPPDWSPIDAGIPVPPLIVPGTVWDKEYKQSVALLTDQMAVMAYNSGLSDAADYSQWTAYQVKTFAEAIGELGAGTEVVIGIPTYEDELPGHDSVVENVESALIGIDAGLEEAGDAAAYVRGVAIYAGWTTDDLEWLQFESGWVKR
jgi:hypothetical protein